MLSPGWWVQAQTRPQSTNYRHPVGNLTLALLIITNTFDTSWQAWLVMPWRVAVTDTPSIRAAQDPDQFMSLPCDSSLESSRLRAVHWLC